MIHLNIGSNLNSKFGSRFDNIEIAINLLIDSKIRVIKVSNFYETPSYPNKSFPKFLNVGLMVNFKKNISKLMEIIDLVERKLGKVKFKKNDPRIIDIDIVDFDGIVIDSDNITLPHPRSHIRNFVLYPILEIDPKWSHPILKKNPQFLIDKLSQKTRIEITRLKKNVNIQL
tara:strand:- start:45 stop:560 length:516 start_codon:yes stop_codon:yes gene_type:complete